MINFAWYTRNVFELFICNVFLAIFSFHVVLLLLWVIVLLKQSNQLRRKVKYSTEYIHNEDTHLNALNAKVEYYKSLFQLAIVSVELVSSILSIAPSICWCVDDANYIEYQNSQQNQTYFAKNNIEFNLFNNSLEIFGKFENTKYNCNGIHSIPLKWDYLNYSWSRIIHLSFEIVYIIVFSLVYVPISYYAMVIKNSLNCNSSMKSVNLAREQKSLILGSFIILLILLILSAIIELIILLELVIILTISIQIFLTNRYARRMIRVFKWKILDTKIAFGTDSFLFKSYTKSLKHFKIFITFYSFSMVSFCIYISFRSFIVIAVFIHPDEIKRVFGFCPPIQQSVIHMYVRILVAFTHFTYILQIIPMTISIMCLFVLNLSTIPYLLSRMNVSCHFKSLFPKLAGSMDSRILQEPLLK